MVSASHRLISIAAASLLFVATAAADRPAKQNKSYNPEAANAAFNSFNTGVVLKIKSASIAKDGTIVTRFTITDSNGAGLDNTGVLTAGPVSVSFMCAFIPNGQAQYTSYTTTVDKSITNSNPDQIQAGLDSGGTIALVDSGTGTYDYTFKTKAPAGFDATATHSIGGQTSRNLAAYGYPTAFTSNDVYSFVPNGSPVTNVRDIVNESSCNNCHNPINAHGGPRTKIAYCVLCHTPQSTNPDSLNTVDLKVFIHKLHMGSNLPSVKAGGKYYVVHRGSLQDYSDIVFPQDIRNCTSCHTATPTATPKQVNNWKTNPTQAACGSCHDNVNFATGQNHVNLIQPDDGQCKQCHIATAVREFDASIPGAHAIPNYSATLAGIVTKVLKVDNASPGRAPTVTFQVSDKAGNALDISKLARIRIVLGGPNVDYQVGTAGVRVSEDPSKTVGSNGVYSYTMTTKLDPTAAGSYTVSIEAYNTVSLLAGTTQQMTATDAAKPVEYYFSVDKSPVMARRQVVSLEKCSACHQDLNFVHGSGRSNTQECVICHNPTLTDGTSKQSVSFATQIHSIHRGSNLANPYVLGTTNYQEVRFPGDLRDCATCHVGQSYQVDNVGAVAAVASPGGFTPTTQPIAAACLGCHDEKPAASHALANTTTLGESCVTCHGINGDFSVDKVHVRQ